MSLLYSPVEEQSFYTSTELVLTINKVTEFIKMKMFSQSFDDVSAINLEL